MSILMYRKKEKGGVDDEYWVYSLRKGYFGVDKRGRGKFKTKVQTTQSVV